MCECVCLMRIKQITLTAGKDIYTERARTHTSKLYRAELAAQNPKCIDHHYNIIILCTLRVHIITIIIIIIIIYDCVIIYLLQVYTARLFSPRGKHIEHTHTHT